MSQLALPLKLQDHAVFESFLPDGNETVCAYLQQAIETRHGPGAWLWGAPATGKSHLLQAVCASAGHEALYLPLSTLATAGPGVLDGLHTRRFICLDDVDRVAGVAAWEEALFALVNGVRDERGLLLCTAAAAPRDCGFDLADLASRFGGLPAFHLAPMDDRSRVTALKLRARFRGLDLPNDAANYLLSHARRDMSSLYALLDTLDTESLRAKRRITVPFVRKVLGFTRTA